MAGNTGVAVSPVKVKKIGHVVFKARDIEASTRFWTDVMGFQVSDRNEIGMVFFRTDSDHHTIALAPAKDSSEAHSKEGPGFDHCAMEIGSVRELFEIRNHLKKHGVKIVFEGRRGAGCNVGVEFLDPDGNMIELYASMDQIGWEGESRPREQWRRATTLEEAVANPVPGAHYEV